MTRWHWWGEDDDFADMLLIRYFQLRRIPEFNEAAEGVPSDVC